MMEFQLWVVAVSALVPLIIGMIWYGPLFSKVWMRESGMTMEKIQGSNMALIYGLALLFSFFLAAGIVPAVIHQMHLYSALANAGIENPDSAASRLVATFMASYESEFRTFGHGALHGFITALMIVFPPLATNALFERKSWTYIFINFGYWAVSLIIMGGIIAQWA